MYVAMYAECGNVLKDTLERTCQLAVCGAKDHSHGTCSTVCLGRLPETTVGTLSD